MWQHVNAGVTDGGTPTDDRAWRAAVEAVGVSMRQYPPLLRLWLKLLLSVEAVGVSMRQRLRQLVLVCVSVIMRQYPPLLRLWQLVRQLVLACVSR